MSKLHFTTKHANEATVKRDWYVVDGTNQTVGRMCARIAAVLRGKIKPIILLMLTAAISSSSSMPIRCVFTGNKLEDKIYINFSGYPGGKKEETAKNLLKRRPEAVLERAMKGHAAEKSAGPQNVQEIIRVCRRRSIRTRAQQPKTFNLLILFK